MEFFLEEVEGNLIWKELPQKNVDFGGGLERVLMCQQNQKDGSDEIFAIEIFKPLIEVLENISGRKYSHSKEIGEEKAVKAFRIIADHIRASSLILADGIFPGNKTQGYILRRFIRRMVLKGRDIGINENFLSRVFEKLVQISITDQPQLLENMKEIIREYEAEESKFRKTLVSGLFELEKLLGMGENLTGKDLFILYETYGYPYEMSLEIIKEKNINLDFEKIQKEYNSQKIVHQELSRTGAERIFKGGLADNSEKVIALHSSQHLLLAAIKKVLGSNDIHQKGSNITGERIRLDFNFDRKITPEELDDIEKLVNKWIEDKLSVERLEMSKTDAENLGAEMEFGAKYPDTVSIYKIPNVSIEFCGGPHISNTSEIMKLGKFKIIKEESSSSGIRRIKATLI